jgi:hypothetical protein
MKVALVAWEAQPKPPDLTVTVGALGVEFVEKDCASTREAVELAADAEVVWVMGGWRGITAEALPELGRCGAIIRSGSGTDNIPVAAATARSILVCNTPEGPGLGRGRAHGRPAARRDPGDPQMGSHRPRWGMAAGERPAVAEATRRVVDASRAAGVAAGLGLSGSDLAQALTWVERGVGIISLDVDWIHMSRAATETLTAMRAGLARQVTT